MLKYSLSGVVAFVLVAVVGFAIRTWDGADAFQNETVGSCSRTVTFNPGDDPVDQIIPDPVNIGATIHEIMNGEAETHVRLFPLNSPAPGVITDVLTTGVATFDTNTADYEGTGTGNYFNPTEYNMTGQFELIAGTETPIGFEGDIQFRQIGGTQPNFDLHLVCTFEVETPTPAPTTPPPDGPFSIVVLKLNDDTNGPIEGWFMELYPNDDCSGDPIDDGFTDEKGLIDFVGLSEGVYSVLEEDDPDFTPDDGNLCREEIEVPGPSDALGVNGVPCPDSGEFPAAGCDSFQSGAQVNVEFVSGGEDFTVTLNGPTTVHRKTAPQDATSIAAEGFTVPSGNGAGNGLDEVTTEIIQLDLEGTSQFGTITVRESPERVSNGIFEEMANANPGTMDFLPDGAHSFFNVYIEVDIIGFGTLHNVDPIVMYCIIFEIPPLLCVYQPPIDDPIELFDEDDQLVARLIHAAHVPVPQGEVFIVFRNVPDGEKVLIMGDWDCDGDSDAVDALAMLTFLAGLTPNQAPGCPEFEDEVTIALFVLLWGDTDCDGDFDTVDVLKILQFIAGLSIVQEPGCPTILDP